MNSIKLIKQIDHIIGPALLKILPRASNVQSPKLKINRILVIRPGGIGDALLLLPVLKELADQFNIDIDILCEPRNENVFKSVTFISNIFSYKNLCSMLSLLKKYYDVVFDTEQSHFLSAIITKLVRADIKTGFKTFGREKMYNKTIEYRHNRYEAKIFHDLFSTAFPLDKPFHFNFPYFIIQNHNPFLSFKKEKIICLFPGATIHERLWPEKRWAEIIDWISKECKPVLIGGSNEQGQCKRIMAHCKTDKGLNLSNKLSIIETAELFGMTKLLISTDSGILHLGVLCNLPTISFFGSGIAAKWAPKGDRHIILNKQLECSPCTQFGTTPPCPYDFECMMRISTEDVIQAIKTKLALFES